MHQISIQDVVELAEEAGTAIMNIYQKDFSVEVKSDNSPLTKADKASNQIICAGLKRLYPDIPILSEEEKSIPYSIRKNWSLFWLIDPLDGTKEFIQKNGEFTVNIALIKNQIPVLGVVCAPAQNLMYIAERGRGAFKINSKGIRNRLTAPPGPSGNKIVVVGSRSHPSQAFEEYVAKLKEHFREVEIRTVGSSMKICLVAEGQADIYPRLGPTMEWDIGAAHAVAVESGRKIISYPSGRRIVYNKENLLNDWFVVE